MSYARTLAVVACLAPLAIAAESLAVIRYVNANLADGANDGTSWDDAYRGAGALTAALAASVSGDQIWVAAGNYLPSTSGVRAATFTLKTGVAVYGGFFGDETLLVERDYGANVTTLSGDLGGNDGAGTLTDNSYHIVTGNGASATAILDGFWVRAGNANVGSSNQDKGGGIIVTVAGSNPTIRNCVFYQNRCTFGGGAGYISPGGATFNNCDFVNNFGGSFGGAFDTNGATTKFERCLFLGNTAGRAGALESFGGASMTITNCIFRANSASGSNGGGAIWASATVTVRDSTFTANSATTLAGCVRTTTGANVTIGNSILWNNTGPGGAIAANQISNGGGTATATYSVVQGGFAGTGNLNVDPLFVNVAGNDMRLQATSPCIDAGSNALVPAGTTIDYDGLARFIDVPGVTDTGAGAAPIVDMGAHETEPPAPPACPADLTDDGIVDGADLGTLLGQWGGDGSADFNGDNIVDGADLGILLGEWGLCD